MLLNLLQLTLSLPPNHQLSSIFLLFSTFLSFSNFPPRLLPLLFSRHFPHSSISLPFLLGPCCPQGVWDRLGDSLYVLLSWPELPSWGSFDGVGDYSSCSLGRIPLSHSSSSSSITCIHRHTDILVQAHSWKIRAPIFSTREFLLFFIATLWCWNCCYQDTVKWCSIDDF